MPQKRSNFWSDILSWIKAGNYPNLKVYNTDKDNKDNAKQSTQCHVKWNINHLSYSEAGVHRCSLKFCYIHKKTPVLQCLFDSYKPKEILTQVFSCIYCEIFKSTFFTVHLRWLLLLFERGTGTTACVYNAAPNFVKLNLFVPTEITL